MRPLIERLVWLVWLEQSGRNEWRMSGLVSPRVGTWDLSTAESKISFAKEYVREVFRRQSECITDELMYALMR